jgi:hypothetical protein
MYKHFSKFNMKQKLHKQRLAARQKTSRHKKRKGISHYKDKVTMKPCSICKATTHGSMLSLHVGDHAVCEFCQQKYFKGREDPQVLLKSAIDMSISQGIEIREALHEIERVRNRR